MKINVICLSPLSQVNKFFLCESTVFGVIPGITLNDQLLEDRIVSNLENLQFCTIFSTSFFLMYKKKVFMY